MILTRYEGRAYRYLPPRAAFEPLNASAATSEGGRFSRPGVAAFYLALEEATAQAAYAPCDHAYAAGELATYRVRLSRIADLSQGYSPKWDPLWDAWGCDWKRMWFIEGIEPPCWAMGEQLRRAGIAGLLFPSRNGHLGVQLVVYPDLLTAQDAICVDDPLYTPRVHGGLG